MGARLHPNFICEYIFYFTINNAVEKEEKMVLINIRKEDSDEMIMQKEMKIEEQLEAMKSLTDKPAFWRMKYLR